MHLQIFNYNKKNDKYNFYFFCIKIKKKNENCQVFAKVITVYSGEKTRFNHKNNHGRSNFVNFQQNIIG